MKRMILAATASMLAMTAAPAWAQDAAEDANSEDDIIVTATRESTLLSKTPLAITAISADGVRDAGITDPRALNDFVPNLAISESGDSVRISIRGVTSTDTTEKGDPSAGFLVDGIYIARPIEVLNSFYDLERLEVLRGPQGTLYGRNTTAGVISVITARPKDEFEASVEGKYGNLSSANLTGMINVPVGEGLGIRAAINYDRQNSPLYQPAPITNSLNPFRDNLSARLSFGGKVGDNFDFVIRGDYSKAKGALYNSLPLSTFFPAALTPRVDPVYVTRSNNRAVRTLGAPVSVPDAKNNKFYGIMGEFTYDFGSMALTYLGSYRKADRQDVRALASGPGYNPAFFFGKFNQTSHELRLAFGQEQPFHGQVGAYYFHEKSNIEFNIGNPLSGLIATGFQGFNPNAIGFAFPQGPTKATSKAAFGQFIYDVAPDLHLTAGIRYTDDSKSRIGATVLDFNTAANSFCNATRCVLNQNVAFLDTTKVTWKIGVDYDAPNLGLIFANVSSGYKAGGFNDGCITGSGIGCNLNAAQLFYQPETLISYEVGFKFRLAGNALRLNGSYFHYDYKSLQLGQIVQLPVPGLRTTNAGSAAVDGIELEAVINASSNDQIDLGVTWTDARFTNFLPDPVGSPNFNFNGKALDRSPKFTATAGYTHTFPFDNGGKVEASVRTKLSSSYFLNDLNNQSQFRQPGFTKTGATVTYKAPDDRFFVQAFVQNIEDKLTLAVAASGQGAGLVIEEPRTFGLRAGFKF